MNLVDWEALERLRRLFLEGGAGAQDYWRTEADLASYNETFAQRIGWKWDQVLLELRRWHWFPPGGELLDWGCGSGIAGRAFLDHFGADSVSALAVWDRSVLAMKFAVRQAQEKYPRLTVRMKSEERPGLLLLSHVLTELTTEQTGALLDLTAQATAIIWIEPGTYAASRALIEVRERLRSQFALVAPCPHQQACGLLIPANRPHWCHHFAESPPEIHTEGSWARFAKLAGIDLRSLPYSYLVMDRRDLALPGRGAVRILGRPRTYKGYGLLFGCSAEGVGERRLSRRHLPGAFRQMQKGELAKLLHWRCEGQEIVDLQPT